MPHVNKALLSDNGGLPELVADGINGYVYPAGNGAGSLAACIRKIHELTQAEYKAMAEYSLDRAERMFNPEKYMNEIEKYYAEYRR